MKVAIKSEAGEWKTEVAPQKGVCKSSPQPIFCISKKTKGRPPKLCSHQAERMRQIYFSERVTVRELADFFGVSRMCAWRTLNQLY